jgi:hypothetical protein
MPIGPIDPGDYTYVTADSNPSWYDLLYAPTATMKVDAAHLQHLTQELLNVQKLARTAVESIKSTTESRLTVLSIRQLYIANDVAVTSSSFVPISDVWEDVLQVGDYLILDSWVYAIPTYHGAGGGHVTIGTYLGAWGWNQTISIDYHDSTDGDVKPNYPKSPPGMYINIEDSSLTSYKFALTAMSTGGAQGVTVFRGSSVRIIHMGRRPLF